MPRRTRRTDAQAAADPLGAPESESSTPAAGSQEAPDSPDSPTAESRTTRSRRTRAPKATAASSPESAPPAEMLSPAPALEETPPEAPRRSRRKKTAEPSPDPVAAATAEPIEAVPAEPAADSPRSRRKRVGGRRGAASPDVVAPVLPAEDMAADAVSQDNLAVSEPPAEAPPGRRRRSAGRRRSAEEPAESSVVAAEIADEVAVEPVSPEAEVAGEGRRSRRSRRGGRRRGKGQEAEPEAASAPQPAETEAPLTLPVFAPAPLWTTPRLVPTPDELDLAPVPLATRATLDSDAGVFLIDGRPYEPRLLFINAEAATDGLVVQQEIRAAAASGIHLHSGVVYLPLKNAYGERSFAALDSLIAQILDSDPDGRILLRLQCVATNFWARTHTFEMMRFGDGSEGDVSFASTDFWRDCVEAVAALLSHLAEPSTAGGDRVIGVHLDKGEWFYDTSSGHDFSAPNRRAFRNWLRAKYQSIYALRAAWFDNSVDFDNAEIPPNEGGEGKKADTVLATSQKRRRWVDYNTYSSEIIAQAITQMAEAIKALSDNALLVAVSYGYTFEFAHRNDSGHQALGKVLLSPAVDMIAGPNSYQNRSAGGPGAFASPVDSIRLNGKLYLLEDDTKTYLATEETEDTYNPKIATPQDTSSVQRRNAAAALVHRCGICWMDLWGRGWLDSEEIWSDLRELGGMFDVASRFRAAGGDRVVPEVAVLVDEASFAYVRSDPAGANLQTGLIAKARDLICRSGASIGFYLQSDIAKLPEGIKLFLFLNAVHMTTQERQAVRDLVQKPGKTLVWLYAPGLFDEKGATAHEVSEIVGMALKAQPWNSKIGTLFTEERHPIIERLHGGKRMGTEDVVNPSFTVVDNQAKVLGEYLQTGNPSLVAKNMEGGWKTVFIGEPHLTGELIRGMYRYAGVHMYDVQDDVVCANSDGLLMVHAPYSGQRTIHLPRAAAVYSLTERRLVSQQSSTFRIFLRGRSSHFFLWGDIARIASALDMSVDDLKATTGSRDAGEERPQEQRSRQRRLPEDELELVLHEMDAEREELNADTNQNRLSDADDRSREGYEAAVLIAEAVTAEVVDLPETPGDSASSADAAEESEPATPSRRRRWQRRRNSEAPKERPATPMSLEELLPDLPPRRQPGQNSGE